MAIELTEKNGGKILEVRLSGKLAHEDFQRLAPEFEKLVKQYGKLRVLLVMADFHGWEADAAWDEIKFDVKHFADIERIAMVGDKKWEQGLSLFCKPFTTATLRYYDTAQVDQARVWLESNLA